jgi:hypothetical protein
LEMNQEDVDLQEPVDAVSSSNFLVNSMCVPVTCN